MSRKELQSAREFSEIIGTSSTLADVITLSKRASDSDIPILIEGESGVGKELFARSIHEHSKRKGKAFVAINCGAIPESLAESILFGHEKGAYTGALTSTIGKFREANGGTLFLDEIGDLPAHIQVKILRTLQEGEVEPVGSAKSVKVDIRIISATNRDLRQHVQCQQFREDLFYRLSTFPIQIPPLRDRLEDFPFLATYFCEVFSKQENKPIHGITRNAQAALAEYHWPGNIRQLKNSIFRAVILCDSHYLDTHHFPDVMNSDVQKQPVPSSSVLMQDSMGHFKPLHKIERDIIQAALLHYHGHITEVSRHLEVSRSTLYRKLHELNISIPEGDGNENGGILPTHYPLPRAN